MHDSFLMRVLNGFTDSNEQLQALVQTQFVVVAESGKRNSIDQFHHKIGPAVAGRPGSGIDPDALVVALEAAAADQPVHEVVTVSIQPSELAPMLDDSVAGVRHIL